MNAFEYLDLQEHPEGGRYREYFRSEHLIPTPRGLRSASTAIYYVLHPGEISKLHRLCSDELWCWHSGGCIRLHMISPHGQYMEKVLGECGETRKNNYSVYIPARWWFGAECEQHPTLASAIVAPGFDFADFELANRSQLLAQFPEHSAIISRLT